MADSMRSSSPLGVLNREIAVRPLSQTLTAQPEGLSRLENQTARPKAPARAPHAPARVRNVGDRIFTAVTTGFAGLILGVLLLMVFILVYQGWPTITKFGFSFLTSTTWDATRDVYGAEPAIVGTLYTSLIALVLAAPVGVLVAIFLTEMAPLKIRFGLGFLVELLSAIPSIVYGLWALFVLVPLVRDHIEGPIGNSSLGNLSLFSGPPIGLGVLTAGLVLSIMILPTIAATSRDVMGAVPHSQREAMLALGATRWETTWKSVIPYARSGIIGGIILALGRAVGETMAVQMVIGNTLSTVSLSLFQTATTMPATLVNQFSEATPGTLFRSALIEIALILMIITVLLNVIARVLVWSVTRRYSV